MRSKLKKPIMDLIYAMTPEDLVRDGWPSDIVNMLSAHNSNDRRVMERLTDHIIKNSVSDDVVTVQIDLSVLKNAQARVHEERRERELEDEFLRRGASNVCMFVLFQMAKDEATARRRLLECGDTPRRGRPNQERSDDINYLWQKLMDCEMEQRAAILEINHKLGLPISEIWNAIKSQEAFQGLPQPGAKREETA